MVLGNLFSSDMAIDVGTGNTLVYVRGKGVVLNEPSVVAYQVKDGLKKALAFGEDGVLSDESELKVTLTDDSLEVAEEVAEKVNEALTDELTDELTEVA